MIDALRFQKMHDKYLFLLLSEQPNRLSLGTRLNSALNLRVPQAPATRPSPLQYLPKILEVFVYARIFIEDSLHYVCRRPCAQCESALTSATFAQSCVWAVRLGCPGIWRRTPAGHATDPRAPISDVIAATPGYCFKNASTYAAATSLLDKRRFHLDESRRAGMRHVGASIKRCVARDPGIGYVAISMAASRTTKEELSVPSHKVECLRDAVA